MVFNNCAALTNWITKTEGTTINDVEDLDLIMSMYNLLEYSSNYSHMTDSLWFYSKYEAASFNADIGKIDAFKYL